MTVFMDTFGLIAWINTRDAAHQRVKSYLDSYSGSIVTTEWVLLELADAFSLSSTKPFAIETIKRIHRKPMFLVVGFDPAVYQAGFDLYVCSSGWESCLLPATLGPWICRIATKGGCRERSRNAKEIIPINQEQDQEGQPPDVSTGP
jgi:hypothetical protein